MGAGKTGNGGKCKRSMQLSKSWVKKLKEYGGVGRKEAVWKRVLAASDEEKKRKMFGSVQRGEEKG